MQLNVERSLGYLSRTQQHHIQISMFTVFHQNSCLENYPKFFEEHREFFFSNAAGSKACNFTEERLSHECFSENVAKKFYHSFVCSFLKICLAQRQKLLNFFKFIKPFFANIPILYSLKTQKKQRLCGDFREYKMENCPEMN